MYLERTNTYSVLRCHIIHDFINKINASRTLSVNQSGALYEPLVEGFLNDLDRLEREWQLT